DDAQADVRLAIALVIGAALGRRQFDPGDIAQAHHVPTLTLRQRDLGEVGRLLVFTRHPQGEIAGLRLDAAGGQLDVLGAQRVLDVAYADVARGHRRAV